MADSEAIANFTAITGASAEEATFYLDAANGDMQVAVESFYSNDGGAIDAGADPEPVAAAAPPPRPAPVAAAPQRAAPAGGMGSMGGMGASGSSSQRRRGGGGSSGNVRSLSDMRNEEDEEDHENEYYTGGEKSGMMVQDPKSRKDGNDVEGLFNRARAAGATDGTPEDLLPPGSRGGRPAAFQGTGRTLSGDPPPAAAAATATPAPPQPVVHTITFWLNGFTVNDGELRSLEDPANRPFMESIARGECPRELETASRDVPVHVNLVRKEVEWKPPPEPKYRAFHGTGRTLGGGDEVAAATPPPAAEGGGGGAGGSVGEMVVDDAQPVTSIQIRLNDGTRLVARFNHTHTVGDIRRFIVHSRPGSGAFRLMTSFPTTELVDDAQTIQAAGLVNAVVIQK